MRNSVDEWKVPALCVDVTRLAVLRVTAKMVPRKADDLGPR